MQTLLRPALAVLVAVLALAGCDAFGNTGSIEVILANESSVATHLLTDTEDFSPSNKVEPGASRRRSVSYRTDNDDPLVFRAGRNGSVLSSVSCARDNVSGQFIVSYTPSGGWLCPDRATE